MKKTGAVLVAAGLSSRMKDFKPMLPYGDSTIALHMVDMIQQMKLYPVVVVTGYRAADLEAHLFHTGVRFVKNERYQDTEMFDSVVLGIKNVMEECERMMIMPVDIPAIRTETIRQALMVDAEMVRTRYHGEPGHPIILSRETAEKLCGYTGDGGLRGAMEHSGITITDLEVDDPGVRWDVDTPEEYYKLIEWNYSQGAGYPIRPQIRIRLTANEPFFGPGTCELLEQIEETGSIREACIRMNLSYSKGSKMIRLIDSQLGFPVVRRKCGGLGGGGSELTESGRRLVKSYRAMEEELEVKTDEIYKKYYEKGFKN
ncbi:MAG: NTP transferase domain-containing protein [Clostridiales bacterium]|nr:NTP transferase domain-containing protein [Clostridiales bacterium]